MWPFPRRIEKKDNPVGSVISSWFVGNPVWTDRQYDKLTQESYVKNAVAYKCVKMISSGAAMVPWVLFGKNGKEIKQHALLDLLNRPAPMTGGHSLFEALYAYLMLSGNGYLAVPDNGNSKRPPSELWTLRPDRVKIIPGQFGLPAAYQYEDRGQKRTFQVDPRTGAGQVLQIKEFHPLNDWYGLSRVDPAAYGIDRNNAAAAHNKALLDNGARPSGALIFKPVKAADGSEVSAPQAVVEAAEKEMRKDNSGTRNAGRPMVFGGNVDWKEMGLRPVDMDFSAGKEDAARDICLAFGVPHMLIVPGNSTYNNVAEAKLELWEETILPLMDKVVDAIDAWLTPRFGDGLKLGVDLDNISALEPRRAAKRASIVDLYDKGLLDDNEARDALQYGPRLAAATKIAGRSPGAVIQALVSAAQTDSGMLEPLYRFLISVGLLDPASTSLEKFIAGWNSTGPSPSLSDSLAALALAEPAPQDVIE